MVVKLPMDYHVVPVLCFRLAHLVRSLDLQLRGLSWMIESV